MPHRVSWVLLLLLSAACGNSNQADPYNVKPLPPPNIENPRGCGELFDAGTASGANVLVDDAAAGCIAEDVQCSLETVTAFAGVCDAGVPYAICTLHSWRLACAALADGGASEAAVGDAAAE